MVNIELCLNVLEFQNIQVQVRFIKLPMARYRDSISQCDTIGSSIHDYGVYISICV